MTYFLTKVFVSALLIATITEVAKRSSLLGAVLASLPLISLMALLWLYIDTKNPAKVAELSMDIFWLVLPSLVLFISLPILLKLRINFYFALTLGCLLTTAAYGCMILILKHYGIK